jgi:hypothetical protein
MMIIDHKIKCLNYFCCHTKFGVYTFLLVPVAGCRCRLRWPYHLNFYMSTFLHQASSQESNCQDTKQTWNQGKTIWLEILKQPWIKTKKETGEKTTAMHPSTRVKHLKKDKRRLIGMAPFAGIIFNELEMPSFTLVSFCLLWYCKKTQEEKKDTRQGNATDPDLESVN